MSKTKENFEAILNEKNIPFNHQEIEKGHHLYRMQYNVTQNRRFIVEIIIQNMDGDYGDAQVIYRQLHLLNDRAKEGQALELFNQLNEVRTGYYNLQLAGDGEIFLRSLLRVGPDAQPLYETVVFGSGIARSILPDLEKILGSSGHN